MFTFLVKKTETSERAGVMGSGGAPVKMEYDDYHMTQSESPVFPVTGGESPGCCRAVSPDKKKRKTTTWGGSAVSVKDTLPKSRNSSGVGIAKTLDFSGQRYTIVVAPRVRVLKVLTTARRTASWCDFHQVVHGPATSDSWPSHLFYVSARKSASVTLLNSTTY